LAALEEYGRREYVTGLVMLDDLHSAAKHAFRCHGNESAIAHLRHRISKRTFLVFFHCHFSLKRDSIDYRYFFFLINITFNLGYVEIVQIGNQSLSFFFEVLF
jgi:hypothetical protein